MNVNKMWIPDRKWIAGGIGGVLTFFIVTAVQMLATHFNIPIPDSAVGWAYVTLPPVVMQAVYYITPMKADDIVKRLNDDLVKLAQNDPSVSVTNPTTGKQ